MTVREKLNELKSGLNGEILENIANEDDLLLDFAEKYNAVHQSKCCAYCRFSISDYNEHSVFCSCLHPKRFVKGIEKIWPVLISNTVKTDVCDLWEESTPENADIEY